MYMTRTLRRLAAMSALAALVFAQLAVSAYACPKGMDGPVRAQAPAVAPTESCPDGMNPNLCESHCQYGSSSVATHAMAFTAPDLAHLPWSAAVVTTESPVLRAPHWRIARSTAPPFTARLTPLRI